MSVADDLLRTLRQGGRLGAGPLVERLGISRATLMRAVRALGPQILVMGRARRTSYAARRVVRGTHVRLPLYGITTAGAVEELGTLTALHGGAMAMELHQDLGWPLDADMAQGWFDGLPYMLDDMRPQGFLGRHFARAHAAMLQVPEDPQRWSDDDIVHALALTGADVPGNYILGETSLRTWLAWTQQTLPMIEDEQLATQYPALAQTALSHGVAGSSAGGEFAKFTAIRSIGGQAVHVLVKFSGADGSVGTERWSDLLVCEHLAGAVLREQLGLEVAQSQVHQAGGRTFLEVHRFDRHGAHGRSPICSWAALNAGVLGMGPGPWTAGAKALFERGWIDHGTKLALEQLWHFGQLIANADMHEGNLSLRPGLKLAPVYDMLPMLYAPLPGVELAERDFLPLAPIPSERAAWEAARVGAVRFWERGAADLRISEGFRAICARNAARVAGLH